MFSATQTDAHGSVVLKMKKENVSKEMDTERRAASSIYLPAACIASGPESALAKTFITPSS